MGTLLNSLDTLIANNGSYGNLPVAISRFRTTTTAATINCGLTSLRMSAKWTVPAFGTGINSAYMTYFRGLTTASAITFAAKMVSLGVLTVSTNGFAAGTTMPTNTIEGASIQTASMVPILAVTGTTNLTATSPVITTTYTDQDGNTGNTCTMTLPTNSILDSCFFMMPHLASGDTGVRAVTNMSKSAGTAGVITAYGLLPLGFSTFGCSGAYGVSLDPLSTPWPMFPLSAGDLIGFFQTASNASDINVFFSLEADT